MRCACGHGMVHCDAESPEVDCEVWAHVLGCVAAIRQIERAPSRPRGPSRARRARPVSCVRHIPLPTAHNHDMSVMHQNGNCMCEGLSDVIVT